MPNILDIGTSAIMAYRSALTATGENIANAETEGYTRRTVKMTEVLGGQMTVTSMNSGGQGVIVQEVERAFDAFLSERVRSTNSTYQSAQSFQGIAQAVEDLFLPQSGGIAAGFDKFFDSLSTLSGNPSDLALRQGVLESGRSMAASMSDVAVSLMSLRTDVETQIDTAVGLLNVRLSELAELQGTLTGAGNSNGGLNPMYDQRDRTLGEIADIVGINTQLDEFGRAHVRLGETLGGPTLLYRTEPTYVSANTEPDLELVLLKNGEESTSTQLSGGLLQGYRNALGLIDDAIAHLNSVARRVMNDVNTLHASGVDLNGDAGAEMFTMRGFEATPQVANRGSAFLEFNITDHAKAQELGDISLVRDSSEGVWIATNADGDELARNPSTLVLDGLTVTILGTPADGDRLTISAVEGRALDMRMALDGPAQLAAASASLVAPAATNTGAGDVIMGQVPVSTPAVDELSAVLPVSGTGADAATLLQGGVVGYIPAGATSLSLAALGTQETASFTVTDAQASAATVLNASIGGTNYSFDLSALGVSTASELAAALNAGTATTADGETLSDLGLFAAGTDGAFTLALGDGSFDSAPQLGGISVTVDPALPADGRVQIFTRNGVQIAGTPFDAASAASLLTEANGFFDGAVYNNDYLYPADGIGYRGVTVDQSQVPGAQTVRLPLGDPLAWGATELPEFQPAQTMTLSYVAGEDQAIDLPQGATARRVADTLNAAVDGLNVSAETRIGLTIPDDGTVSFTIMGSNTAPVRMTALVSGGRMDAMAAEINSYALATGVSASLSPNGDRIVLTQDTGLDIVLGDYTHSVGGTMQVNHADENGMALGSSALLGAGNTDARFTGDLVFEAPDVFTVGYKGSFYTSDVDTAAGGLVERSFASGGAVQTFDFATNPDFDAGARSVDGLTAQANASRFDLTVRGTDVSYLGATPATGVASALRQTAPQSTLTGGAVSSLPVEGTATSVMLGDDTYTLRMGSGGEVTVSGPEEGRITAAFDSGNRLVIAVTDGTLNGDALRVLPAAAGAASFGLSSIYGAQSTLTGQDMDTAGLPATMQVEVAGTLYNVDVTSGGATVPAGFPGSASMTGGVIEFSFDAGTGPISIPQSAAATAAGFGTLGLRARVDGDTLTLTATDGSVVDTDIQVSALAAQRITLNDLPAEDLIVVMTGAGNLRLGGSYEAGTPPDTAPDVSAKMLDAENGRVQLLDTATGHVIAERTLDSSRSADFGGVQVAFSGAPDDGDEFRMVSNAGFVGDSRNVNAMAALRNADPTTGKGGFGRILAALQAQKGAVVAAANQAVTVADATRESAEKVYADRTDVNLDAEAARLIDQQQAYQASAQILQVASELFDTLLNSL